MLMVNQLAGFGSGGALALPSVAFCGNTENGTANQTSYSFTSQNFGTEAATRRLVCVCGWEDTGNSRSISSMTIGGVAATAHANPNANTCVGIFSAPVPTGASGTIAISMSGQNDRMFVSLFALYNAAANPLAIMTDAAVSSNVLTGTINVPADGIVIAGVHAQILAGVTVNWTGVTNQFNGPYPSSAGRLRAGAMASGLAANGSYTVTATGTGSIANGYLAAASWGA